MVHTLQYAGHEPAANRAADTHIASSNSLKNGDLFAAIILL